MAGVALGLLLLGLLAGFGLGTIVSDTRWLYETVRWAGVAYLVWLAWDTWREAQRPIDGMAADKPIASYFLRGLITNLLNPKAAVFYIAVLPNFVTPLQPAWSQSLVLTAVYVVVATLVHLLVVLLASALRPYLISDRFRRRAGIVFGLLLVGIAVWIAVSTARTF